MPRELRVRDQRRTEVSVSQPRRRALRRGQRTGGSVVAPLGAGGGRRRPRGTGLSRSLHRQRLRRLGAVPERGRPVPRSGTRSGRGVRAEERHERVGRRRPQRRAASPSTCRTSRKRASCCRATTSGCRRGVSGGMPALREHGAMRWASTSAAGASARSLATSTTTVCSTLSRQRLRVGVAQRQLLVRLLEGGGRARGASSPMRRTGRRWTGRSLAGYQQKKVWVNDGGGPLRRRGADGWRHRSLRRPLGGARRPLVAGRARRRRREPERAAAAVPQRRGAGPPLGRLRARRQLPRRHGVTGSAATAAPLARR